MAAEETAASAATSAPAATAATTVATAVDAVAAVATSELEAALGELNLSEDADAQMNEDTNDLLPDLDENDEDGPGFSYVHLPRNGHEVIPFPSYTTRPILETRHTLHSTQVQEGLFGVVAAMAVRNETTRRGSTHRHSMVTGNLARLPARSGSIMDELD